MLDLWQQLAKEAINGGNVEGLETRDRGLHRYPLYLSDNSRPFALPSLEREGFVNILEEENLPGKMTALSHFAVQCDPLQFRPSMAPYPIFFHARSRWEPDLLNEVRKMQSPVDLGLDPYSLGLWKGEVSKAQPPFDEIGSLLPNFKIFRLTSLPYDLAGANDVQQLGVLMASTVQLLKDFEGSYPLETLVGHLSFQISVSPQNFVSIAKLQSFRVMLLKLFEELGLPVQKMPPVFSLTSPRYLCSREPSMNLLRITSGLFSSILGGAKGYFHYGHDLFSKSNNGSRLSRNASLVLELEAQLAKVDDPTVGSWMVDELSHQLCEKAWSFFREIEGKGGLVAALQAGWLQEEIERSGEKEWDHYLHQKKVLVGVNQFVLNHNLNDQYPLLKEEDVLSLTDWWISIIGEIDCEKLADVQPLRPQQLSQAFEKWQWKSDQRQVDKGNRPRVLVVIEEGGASTKKWQWLKSAMDCGGVELLQFVDHKTAPSKLAFFIGSDPESHFAEEQTQKLRDMGVQKIIWIGDRDQKLFDDFLENGSNLFEFFSHFYETLGGDQ